MGSKPHMYFGAGCALLVAVVLALLGLLYLLAGIAGNPVRLAIGAGMLLVGGAGAFFTIRQIARLVQNSPDSIDERVLALARMSGGDVTAGEVVGALSITTEDAQASLERLVQAGMAEHKVRGDDLYYTFAGMREVRKVKRCGYCGSEYSIREPGQKCPSCGGNLEVVDAED